MYIFVRENYVAQIQKVTIKITIVFVIKENVKEDVEGAVEKVTFPVIDEICNATTVTVIFFLLPLQKKENNCYSFRKNNRNANGATSVTSQLSEGTVMYR